MTSSIPEDLGALTDDIQVLGSEGTTGRHVLDDELDDVAKRVLFCNEDVPEQQCGSGVPTDKEVREIIKKEKIEEAIRKRDWEKSERRRLERLRKKLPKPEKGPRYPDSTWIGAGLDGIQTEGSTHIAF